MGRGQSVRWRRSYHFLLVLAACLPARCAARTPPAKVFLIMGDDNVEGFGYLKQLEDLMKDEDFADTEEAEKYSHLVDPDTGRWAERDDVFVLYEHERHKPWRQGRLNMHDYGGIYNETFGPEVEMGHVLGNTFDEPVILVKAGWSKKSLGHDFLPPSSDGFTGFAWVRAIDAVHHAIQHADRIIGSRQYKGGRAELAGVVWWHGYSDLTHASLRERYRINLRHLVGDLRTVFRKPDLPIVVGELGGTGRAASDWELGIRRDQRAVCALPQFNRTTLYAETAQYVHREEPRFSNNVHYYGRGDTMIEIGSVFATKLLDLMFSQEQIGETEIELEADMELDEENEEFGAGMVMIFVMGVGALGLAIYQRYRTGSTESLRDLVYQNVWWVVRLVRPKNDVGGVGNADQGDENEDEAVEFSSLPGSDSSLVELDEVSSHEGDGIYAFR